MPERAVHPVGQHRGDVARECFGVVRRKEQPGHAVGDELGSRACVGGHDGPPGQHPLEHREAEAFPARGVDDDVAAPVEGRDVSDAPRHEDAVGHAQLARERFQPLALGPLAEHEQRRVGDRRERANRRVDALLRREPCNAEQQRRAVRDRQLGVLAPRLGQRVEPVVDDLDLVLGQPDVLDAEAPHGLADGDDPRALAAPARARRSATARCETGRGCASSRRSACASRRRRRRRRARDACARDPAARVGQPRGAATAATAARTARRARRRTGRRRACRARRSVTSTPFAASAGSSVSRCRSEPPMPPMRWTCDDLHARRLQRSRSQTTAAPAASASTKSHGTR